MRSVNFKNIIFITGTLFLTHCASSAFHSKKAAQKELEELKYFAGDWKCQTQWIQHEPEKLSVMYKNAESHFSWYLEGYWLKGNYLNHSSEGTYINQCFYGYDSKSKKYRQLCIGDHEGWSLAESAGWEADTLKFVGKSRFNGLDLVTYTDFKKVDQNKYSVDSGYQTMDQEKRGKAGTIIECQRQMGSSVRRHSDIFDAQSR